MAGHEEKLGIDFVGRPEINYGGLWRGIDGGSVSVRLSSPTPQTLWTATGVLDAIYINILGSDTDRCTKEIVSSIRKWGFFAGSAERAVGVGEPK